MELQEATMSDRRHRPVPASIERLRTVDWQEIRDRYLKFKNSNDSNDPSGFPVIELADAVCALYYVEGWSTKEISVHLDESYGFIPSLTNYAFLTEEVRCLATFDRPAVKRLGTGDIDIIHRLPAEKQLGAAENLIASRKSKGKLYAGAGLRRRHRIKI
jgi:hypothetical protein